MKHDAVKSPTISIRLPPPTLKALDEVAKTTRRSRSFIMKEALDRHLADLVKVKQDRPKKTLSNLLKYAGAGKGLGTPRTAEQVIADIRWLRDSD
jgi:RHH-type transcriptional regulator, rel operon repressor / antitoxin RelB